MWIRGIALLVWAADEPTGSGTGSDQLVIVIGGIATALIGGIVAVVVATINARANRTAPAPPPPVVGQVDPAEVRRRLDDGDEARELIDRRQERHERAMDRFGDRIERIEDHLDRSDPGWRAH